MHITMEQPSISALQDRWGKTWEGLGVTPPETLLAELTARYSEEHRHYHTLQHIETCLTLLNRNRHLAERPAELELALWFHDAVYDTCSSSNEEDSARLAQQALLSVGLSQDHADRVGRLILTTKHDAAPETADERLLIDIDLSILGAAETCFLDYERCIRLEYAWVPEELYRPSRARILRAFLERPSLYTMPWFIEQYEEQARINLAHSLKALSV